MMQSRNLTERFLWPTWKVGHELWDLGRVVPYGALNPQTEANLNSKVDPHLCLRSKIEICHGDPAGLQDGHEL